MKTVMYQELKDFVSSIILEDGILYEDWFCNGEDYDSFVDIDGFFREKINLIGNSTTHYIKDVVEFEDSLKVYQIGQHGSTNELFIRELIKSPNVISAYSEWIALSNFPT